MIEEIVEIESGSVRDRPGLVKSIARCKTSRAILLIAKLDRLARSVAFVSSLMEGGTEFVAVDMPFANKLMLHLMAAFAEHEKTEISNRTKAALAAAKARGVVLGSHGRVLAAQRQQEASDWSEVLREPVQRIREGGAVTYRDMATGLNNLGFLTRQSCRWGPGTTQRLIRRLEASRNVS